MNTEHPKPERTLKGKIYKIVFESDTRWGRYFDEALLVLILLSIGMIMLSSVAHIDAKYGRLFFQLEIIITSLFLIEYAVRIWSFPNKVKYIFQFFWFN